MTLRKGQKLVNAIAKYIHAYGFSPQVAVSWSAPKLFQMSDKEFDEKFGKLMKELNK